MNFDDQTIYTEETAGETTLKLTPRKAAACFVQYTGDDLGKRFRLEARTAVIGRSPNVQIQIADRSVSRNHALCTKHGSSHFMTDLNSANGTFVNEQRIGVRHELKDGDIVRTGTVVFKYFSSANIENLFHDRIYRMATIDDLTQAFNKKYLLQSLDTEFQFSRSQGTPLSVVSFDLDHFKEMNDTHGHLAGDQLLRRVADAVKALIRQGDMLCRFGGDEFFIILPGAPLKAAVRIGERIRHTIENTAFDLEGTIAHITTSVGATERTEELQEAKDLIQRADDCLYDAKQQGRNCCVSR